jgi:drug/metabolite transporter (DMT)-like permease
VLKSTYQRQTDTNSNVVIYFNCIMTIPVYIILPLIAAVVYTVAAMLFKKVLQNGANLWYINFLSNIVTCLFMVPVYFSGQHHVTGPIPYIPALVVSVFFIAGQAFSLIALKYGDVSVATPLLGTKVLMVALFTILLLGIPVPLLWWIASILAVVAMLFLRGQDDKSKKSFVPTVIFSLLCALGFALSDIYIQKWAPVYGPDRLIFIVFIMVALLSIAFVPLFWKTKFLFKSPVSSLFAISIVCIALQSVLVAVALSRFGNATAVNIAFSSRGMWSVIFIWLFGSLIGNDERLLGTKTFWQRLTGSVCILLAIILVLVKN